MAGVLIRALTYSALFIGALLVYLPARTLAWAGIEAPARFGWPQIFGASISAIGAALAIWCILSFALLGRGTPAPFDPPRRLVIRGPYRHVRNPMYLGAGLALAGAALAYQSMALLSYAAAFLLVMHVLVLVYEEPALSRAFGGDYATYCGEVGRWRPKL